MPPVGYTIGNILFLMIGESYNKDVIPKYVKVSWTVGIYTTEIWTVEEIKTKYPNVKEVNSLLDIKEIYQAR